jgi:hypothetical protein
MTNNKSPGYGGGERPITDADGDKLSRGGFVERIAEALITDDGKAARGVVIGVTGPWGSGKSSILNLVDQEIRKRSPQAVVVRFDPWIISGQQDLILSFLRETIRTIEAEPERAKNARKLLDGLATYAAYLAPVFNAAVKNSGDVAKAVLEALNKTAKGDQSLAGQRQKLEELIVSLGVPVVVLIDELDRVEDDEVRAVAQLVRAVGDFSGISYVLAYDPRRVAQALGRGSDAAASAHGRAYLEKIVQLPLALPVAMPGELRAMLDAELNQVLERLKLASPVGVSLRYDDIANAITPRLASTPRDIKRLVGIFHPLMAMVKSEVDPIDVFGFSALIAKAPLTVERISANPNLVVDDPLTFEEAVRRSDNHGIGSVEQVLVEPDAEALVTLLFPALAGRRQSGSHRHRAIAQWRGLMTVLRLGLLPQGASKSEIETLLSSDPAAVAASLDQAVQEETLTELLEGLIAIYTDRFAASDLDFWRGAADYLNRTDRSAEWSFVLLPNLASNLARILETAAGRRPEGIGKAQRILNELLGRDDMVIAPYWLSGHLEIHGIGPHGRLTSQGTGGDWFLNASETASVVNNAIDRWRNAIVGGHFFQTLRGVQPLRILLRMGAWDEQCQKALANALGTQIGHLAMILYLPDDSISVAFIETLVGASRFKRAVIKRLDRADLQPTEREALELAKAHLADVPMEETARDVQI